MPFRSVFMTLMIKLPKVPTLCYVFQEVNVSLQQENRAMEKEVFIFVRFSSSLEKDGRKQSVLTHKTTHPPHCHFQFWPIAVHLFLPKK